MARISCVACQSRSGFTLVELSIVLVIVGLLTASGLAVGAKMVERAAYIDTRRQAEQLKESLVDYYIVYGRLPCVARLTPRPSATDFGEEIANCASGAAGPADTFRHGSVRVGAVPVRTLGLPDSAAGDKFGNRFVYSVTEQLTDADEFGAFDGAITVQDANGAPILANAAFFIASPGRDRKGGYNYLTGAASACGASGGLDAENCDVATDGIFRDAPFNNGDTAANFFDDITSWAPKYHFMSNDTQNAGFWVKHPLKDNIIAVGADTATDNTFVGIGTSDPLVPLHITGTMRQGINYTRTDARDARISVADPTQQWSIASGWATAGDFSIIQEADGSGPSAGNRFYIQNSTGNVGLSTSSPDYRLHVAGDIKLESTTGSHIVSENPHGSLVMNFPATGTASTNGFWVRSNTTPGSASPYTNLMVVRPSGRMGVNHSDPAAELHVRGNSLLEGCCHGYYAPASPVGKKVWRTGVQTLDSMFFIGYRNNDQISNLGAKGTFSIEPFRIFYGAGNGSLDILPDSTVRATVVPPSDARLKRDVKRLSTEEALEKLRALQPVTYHWKDTQRRQERQFGFIAQDVREVWPELVVDAGEGQDNLLALHYDGLIAPLVTATQQLLQGQEATTARLERLEQHSPKAASVPADRTDAARAGTLPLWAWAMLAGMALLFWRMVVLQRQVARLTGGA